MTGSAKQSRTKTQKLDCFVAPLLAMTRNDPLRSLLLFPERQQALRRRATDHAGDADRDLAEGGRRDAAERDRADADLTPEIEIAPGILALGIELFQRGLRIHANCAELHRVGGLDHF